jgi:hypothetical protein
MTAEDFRKGVVMTPEETRAHIASDVREALDESGVDLSSMSEADLVILSGKIANSLLDTVDRLLDQAQPAPEQEEAMELDDENAEKILWEGRPFLSLVEKYVLTSERLKIIRGMVSRAVENFELIRIQDIDLKQNVSERVMGIGDITIRGADESDSLIVIRNVKDPEKVYEIMRRAWLDARKRYGLQFREYM